MNDADTAVSLAGTRPTLATGPVTAAIAAFESERISVRRRLNQSVLAIAGAAVAFGACCTFTAEFEDFGHTLFRASLIGLAVYLGIYQNARRQYRSGFKELMRHVIAAVNPQLQYAPDCGLDENEFRASQLFRKPDRYHCEDLITGCIGATNIRFSEVHAECERGRTQGQSESSAEHYTLFRGLFFIAGFNKNFHGTTLLLPDTAERMLGHMGQSLQAMGAKISHPGLQLIKLENPKFEKLFVVYGSDQIEARYLLSPALMDRLVKLQEHMGHELYVSFSGNLLYVAVSTADNFFEAPPMNKPVDSHCIVKYFQQLKSILDIVDTLDLNTRIWGSG